MRIRFISPNTYPAFHIPAGRRDAAGLCLLPAANPCEMKRGMGEAAGEREILKDREGTHLCLRGIRPAFATYF